MNKKEMVLAGMAPARQAEHSPVQLQKLFFLLDRNIAELVDGPHFNFAPYHYGPFDKAIYDVLWELEREGYVDSVPERTWTNYRLTAKGQSEGDRLLAAMEEKARNYVQRVSEFVRTLSFTQLVSAIYRAYPEMRDSSVFQG